jgi:hypothetical protein
MPQPPRYCPELPLPPYSYVTGLAPHPTRDPAGHSYGRHEPPPAPLNELNYRASLPYLYGLDLFNHGFYWEAHEAWEALWHAAGRTGPTAALLKGLIKLAAAGVKAREGRAAGVRQHAQRAAELVREAQSRQTPRMFGLSLTDLIVAAESVADASESLVGDGKPDAARHLPVTLTLD